MRTVCILAPRFPFPENGGDVLRINNIGKHFKDKGYRVVLLSIYEKKVINKHEQKEKIYDKIYVVNKTKMSGLLTSFLFLFSTWPLQIGYYFSIKYLLMLKKIIKDENPDIYVSHLLRMVPYLRLCSLESKSIIEMTDALSKTYDLSSKDKSSFSIMKLVYKIEKKRIAYYEKYVIKRFKKIVLVSQQDKKYLMNPNNVFVYRNGIICVKKICTNYDENKIVFIGNMRTLQNQTAVLDFVGNILPYINLRNPQVKLYIVGAEPPECISRLHNNQNIFVTGFIDNIEEIISDAALAVAPIKIGAGLQNKVLLSMACHVPVVVSSLIAEGIPELHDDVNCFIRNTNNDFSNACVELLNNRQKRNSFAEAGYKLVEKYYDWDSALMGYETIS